MKRTIWLSLAALLVVCGTGRAAGVNIVTNGSFEQGSFGIGSFQGWQTNLGDISTFVDSSGETGAQYGQATDGLWATYFGTPAAAGGSSISETLVTTVNQSYLLSFDLANDNAGLSAINGFLVSVGTATPFSFTNKADQNFIHYQFQFLASNNATQLKFSSSNDNSYFELDNVSVTTVAEPFAAALWVVGTLGIGLCLRGVTVGRLRRA